MNFRGYTSRFRCPLTLGVPLRAALIAGIVTSPASAQIIPDAGTTLRQLEPPTITLPRKPPPDAQIEPPARPALEPAPDMRFPLKGFRISGATVFREAELQQLLADFLGREVGIADLGDAVGRVTRYYSEHGYPLATAYLPAQDIRDGVVEIVILEGRIGNIDLLNRSRVRDSVIAQYLEPLSGRVIEDARLERQLLLIYDLPTVVPARAVLAPGQTVGESDLHLALDPGPVFSGAVQLDNYGNLYTGRNELSAQLTVASPARLGDLLSVYGTTADSGLNYGRLSYQLPLGEKGLRAGATYSQLHYRLGKTFSPLAASGEAESATAFVQYAILRSRLSSVYGELSYERRSLQDRIDAIDAVSDKNIGLLTFSLSGTSFDSWGGNAANAWSLRYGAGNLDLETPAVRAVDTVTARTDGSYRKLNLSFVRLQEMTERLSVYGSFYGQKAGDNLDSSEKMILGGINGVRAYPQGEAAGDTGYLLSLELRYSFSLTAVPGVLQLAGFVDAGEVKLLEEPFSALPNRRRLSGGGLSLSWSRANDFTVRATVAHRIGNEHATAGSDAQTRGWFQAIKNF